MAKPEQPKADAPASAPAPAAAEPAKPTALDEKEVLELVDNILQQQDKKGITRKWEKAEHLALIRKVLKTQTSIADDELRDVIATLEFKGIGGNASQFKQYLASKDGGARIKAGTAAILSEYE